MPDNASLAGTEVLLKDPLPGIEVVVSVFTSDLFGDDPNIEYKIQVNGSASSVGKTQLVSLVVVAGNGKEPDTSVVLGEGDSDYESRTFTERFTEGLPNPGLTSDSNTLFGDNLGRTRNVVATVIQKPILVIGANDTGGLGDPGSPDALFVVTHPGRLGDGKAGRYRLVMPAIGGDRGPVSITQGSKTVKADNPDGLTPKSGQPDLGAAPPKETVFAVLGDLPTGDSIDTVDPAPDTEKQGSVLQWTAKQSTSATQPLRIRLAVSESAQVGRATAEVFGAGVLLAVAASCLLLAVDRLVREKA